MKALSVYDCAICYIILSYTYYIVYFCLISDPHYVNGPIMCILLMNTAVSFLSCFPFFSFLIKYDASDPYSDVDMLLLQHKGGYMFNKTYNLHGYLLNLLCKMFVLMKMREQHSSTQFLYSYIQNFMTWKLYEWKWSVKKHLFPNVGLFRKLNTKACGCKNNWHRKAMFDIICTDFVWMSCYQ